MKCFEIGNAQFQSADAASHLLDGEIGALRLGGVVRRVANGHLQTSLINDILLTIDTQLHNELISP
jgi:hypothetical protein